MISVEIEDSVLFEPTPSVNGVPVIALPENHHVRIAVSQAPLMLFHSLPLTSDNVKLVLFIAAFLVHEAQNVVYRMSSRHVSVRNQILHLIPSSVYLLIFGANLALKPSVVVLKLHYKILRFSKVVVKQGNLHVLFVYRPLLLLHRFLVLLHNLFNTLVSEPLGKLCSL